MTKEQHPIIPPPELIHQWHQEACKDPYHGGAFFQSKTLKHIATRAAQWGADEELEACCKWLPKLPPWSGDDLRRHRRPKPPSLKEQALALLEPGETRLLNREQQDIIRRALEKLPDE